MQALLLAQKAPYTAEHGLKRRRHSDETPRPSVKHRAAGVCLVSITACSRNACLLYNLNSHYAWCLVCIGLKYGLCLSAVRQGGPAGSAEFSLMCSFRGFTMDAFSFQDACKADGARAARLSRTQHRCERQEKLRVG